MSWCANQQYVCLRVPCPYIHTGLIIALYTTGDLDTIFSPQHKAEAIRYFRNHQNKDGGFGLHIEGHSTMFGTVLQ